MKSSPEPKVRLRPGSSPSGSALRALARWYEKHRRDLPWRQTSDPYAIWVSEILLQQTQVETVRPYFLRFMKTFPTVKKLAAAAMDDVLKAWEGCGYYARARNLHRAAQEIVKGGRGLPRTAAEWRALPGIGDYTAAAIASIALNEPVAAIDGNVIRVISRLLLEKRDVNSTLVKRRIAGTARRIMADAVALDIPPGVVTQAMMEIGATVCMPRRALCGQCPLKSECRARQTLSDVTSLPVKARARAVPHYDIGAAIVRRGGRILITQRPHDGMLGGLWEFPGGKRHEGESLEACVAREIEEELGITIEVGRLFAKVKHAYTHFKITLWCFECRPLKGRIRKLGIADYRWVAPEELSLFAFPKADRVIIDLLQKPAPTPHNQKAVRK